MALKRSRRGLQLRFRPRCDPSRQSRVMAVQSSGSPVGTISGLHFGSPGNLCHLDVGAAYTIGSMVVAYSRGPGRGVSRGPKCSWLVPTPKGVPNAKLTSCGWFLDVDSNLIY
jgi:hypothetical protein